MSHDTPHPSEETLLRALDGELSSSVAATLESHLAACDGCRIRAQAIRATAAAASAACRDQPAIAEPALDALRLRLQSGLPDRSEALERSWRFRAVRFVAHVPAAALAAAALVVVALGGAAVQHTIDARSASGSPAEAGALPIAALTPGATAHVTVDDLCAGRGPSKEEITLAVRLAVLRDYGMEALPEADYELDYLITPELGGSSDRRNLWPERYGSRVWNARVKDELEQLLPSLVCRGSVDLTTAQRDIAVDWIAAYKKYFRTDRPMITQARAMSPE
jgi:hypothetical protein